MLFKIKGKSSSFVFETDKEVTSIGRSSDNDFVISLPDFSRKHCVITVKGEYIFIMDLGSKNGVEIDGHKIRPNEQYPIYANSRVRLARHFDFILPDGTAIKEIDLKVESILPRR